jgi:hypothetical protein
MITESEKGYQVSYNLCAEDKRTTHVEQGYKFLLKENDQNAHVEGICWSFWLYQQQTGSPWKLRLARKQDLER